MENFRFFVQNNYSAYSYDVRVQLIYLSPNLRVCSHLGYKVRRSGLLCQQSVRSSTSWSVVWVGVCVFRGVEDSVGRALPSSSHSVEAGLAMAGMSLELRGPLGETIR